MYEILIEKNAERDCKNLPLDIFRKIKDGILSLKTNPRSYNSKKLHGSKDDRRIRIGDYRVLYEVNDEEKIIKIFRIKHRKDVYR